MNTPLTVAEAVDCLVHDELTRDELTRDESTRDESLRAEAVRPQNSTEARSPAFDLDKARLYVVPLTDDSTRDAFVLLDEDENPYRLLRRTRHHPPVLAACVVATGWCAPFALDDDVRAVAPSEHPQRQRVRLSTAITDSGIASVLRKSSQPAVVLPLESRGMGDLPDVLEAWWRGC